MKPNNILNPDAFDENFVETQLKYSSLFEYKTLIEQGFPHRIGYDEFLCAYNISTEDQQQKLFDLGILLRSIGIDKNDVKIGNARICFRPLKIRSIDDILRPTTEFVTRIKGLYDKKLIALRRWTEITRALLLSNVVVADVEKIAKTSQILEPMQSQREKRTQTYTKKHLSSKCSSEAEGKPKPGKQKKEERPTFDVRYDRMDHFPDNESNPSRTRCKMEGCSLRSNFFCIKCKVHLCIKPGKNCFLQFHTLTTN